MKRYLYILLFVAVLFSFTACIGTGGEKMIVKYEIELSKVQKVGSNETKVHVPMKDTSLEEIRYSYEDELTRSIWFADEGGWDVTFYNKTDKPIMIDWDEVSYMDIDKIGHRVLSKNTKVAEKDEPQNPSIVARRGSLSEKLFPAEFYYQSSTGVMSKRPMFPIDFGEAKRYENKNYSLIIPLTVEGFTAQYEFVFTIKEVKQELSTKDPWSMYLFDRTMGINY